MEDLNIEQDDLLIVGALKYNGEIGALVYAIKKEKQSQ